MCTREETRQEIELSEKRMEAKIEKSHMAIAETISNYGAELKRVHDRLTIHTEREEEYQDKIEQHLVEAKGVLNNIALLSTDDIKALKDIAQGYAGMSAMRKLILGLASTIIAIGAVVAGFITLIKSIK